MKTPTEQKKEDIATIRWAVICLRSHKGYSKTANELVDIANRMEAEVEEAQT